MELFEEPRAAVLWPLARRAVRRREAAPRLSDLNGKTICELWDVIFRGETIYPLVREYLRSRFPGSRFVEYSQFGNIYGPKERDVIASLPGKLRQHGCDAVIAGIGA
ncbi:MAG: hypothetical protein GEV05_15410 [Betaproteobacteria bacterium]|nr:hypothetical protein [Betaproteobacteria bacterium]